MLPLVGGQGGLNLGVQLTLQQPGADYAHPITTGPPGFENPAASLKLDQIVSNLIKLLKLEGGGLSPTPTPTLSFAFSYLIIEKLGLSL